MGNVQVMMRENGLAPQRVGITYTDCASWPTALRFDGSLAARACVRPQPIPSGPHQGGPGVAAR